MNKKLFYLLLVSFFLIAPLYAQEEETVPVHTEPETEQEYEQDLSQEEFEESTQIIPHEAHEEHRAETTPYIKPFGNKFSLYLSAYKSNLDFEQTYNNTEKSYTSNTPLEIGLGFLYKSFGLEFGQQTSFLYDSNRPKTETLEWRLNYYARSAIFEIQVKDYKGFYTGSKEDTDLRLQFTGISGQYIWNNEKYSWRAAFGLYERQNRSAGSLLLGGNVFYMMSKRQLPDPYKKKYILATPNIGYAYTWVYKNNLFFALSPSVGFGMAHELSNTKNHIAIPFALHGAAGYHWGDVSFMLSYKFLVMVVGLDDVREDAFMSSLLQCTVAKRF
ncbi:MAG: DUF4421 domain-containing protein [Leptospirales bacterium]|nr:DUF4421 domain-containing protein [Leptospirales bacterium]